MSKPRFLVDENLDLAIAQQVRHRIPDADILHVGDDGAPPNRTPDPEVLTYCEQSGRILVMDNRHSMPAHVADLFAAGHHHAGILIIRGGRKSNIGGIIDTLVLIWELEEAEGYLDREEWIPF